MSEIADELERMAEEFEAQSRDRVRRRDAQVPGGDLGTAYQEDGCADGFARAAGRLRERAAELRAQSSGPTYKPQPKPTRARVRQWWSYDGLPPKRIAKTSTLAGKTTQTHAVFELCSDEADMLTDPRWRYLGDGERPDLGGSEVAGEVGR
jgi:hypothetical protein